MKDYQGNSYKERAEQERTELKSGDLSTKKNITKVIDGQVKTKKRTEASKFRDAFLSEDVSNVKNYILMGVLVPAVKKAIKDIVSDGIEMLLYGESTHNRSSNRLGGSFSSPVNYDRFSSGRRDDYSYRSSRTSSNYTYEDIIFGSRGEAEKVLESMDGIVDMYGSVSMGDLYDLIGITGKYTDNKYGWRNIRNAEAVRCRDGGYMLKLPKAIPLD